MSPIEVQNRLSYIENEMRNALHGCLFAIILLMGMLLVFAHLISYHGIFNRRFWNL
jgi:hypothetical protein